MAVTVGAVTKAQSGSTNHLLVRQSGHVVTAYGYMDGISIASANTETLIATISGVTAPADTLRTMCQVSSAAYTLGTLSYLSINTSGQIKVTTSNTGSGKVIYFNAVWVV